MATVRTVRMVVAFGGFELIRLRHEKMKECRKTFSTLTTNTQICLLLDENS